MGVYDNQIAMAQRLIREKGRPCMWREIRAGSPNDASQPWKQGKRTYEDYAPVHIVFFPESRKSLSFLRYLTDTDVTVGDEYGLMGQVDFTPTVAAQIRTEDGAKLLRVVRAIQTLAPNGETVLHTIKFGVAPSEGGS